MIAQRVTIAVVPRERFSQAQQSLLNILTHTDPAVPLIYIDGGSPPLVRQFLEQRSARHGFRLISTEKYMSPNQARNLALAQVRTPYVVFVDNDIIVSPGWLEALVECAESTGAWAVGSVCCQGETDVARIHCAGGDLDLEPRGHENDWPRILKYQVHQHGKRYSEVAHLLRREPVGQVTFQTMLVRRCAFDILGPLDESLLSAAEDLDFCLRIRRQGQAVYLEPRSLVTYLPPPPFEEMDREYFQLRWSDAWNRASLDHFQAKWKLSDDDPALARLARSLDAHRRLTFEPYRRVLRLLGRGPATWFENLLIAPLEQAASRRKFPAACIAEESQRRAA